MGYRVLLALISALSMATGAAAEVKRGQFAFGAERSCVAARNLGAEQCANAAANAQAEFDAKAPRFATREACQRIFPSAGCTLGFSGSDGWAGKKSGIYFAPRQLGFRVVVASERDMTVVPFTSGPAINFAPRSILKRRDMRIDPKTAQQAREAWRARPAHAATGGVGQGGQFGVDTPPPGADREALPPSPPVDPNFDCAAVLEPSARDHADTGCYLAPARRR